jgi:hypothetical protein
MAEYTVLVDSFIDVTTNDKGDVTGKKYLTKGDTFERSEEDAERLVRSGAVRLTSDDEEEESAPVDPGLLAYQGGVTGGAGDAEQRTTSAPLDGSGGPLTDDDKEVAPGESEGDQYDEMDKGQLQAEAESRDLPKSGTVKELQARLRDNDEAQKS